MKSLLLAAIFPVLTFAAADSPLASYDLEKELGDFERAEKPAELRYEFVAVPPAEQRGVAVLAIRGLPARADGDSQWMVLSLRNEWTATRFRDAMLPGTRLALDFRVAGFGGALPGYFKAGLQSYSHARGSTVVLGESTSAPLGTWHTLEVLVTEELAGHYNGPDFCDLRLFVSYGPSTAVGEIWIDQIRVLAPAPAAP